jgi:hypothetical protein
MFIIVLEWIIEAGTREDLTGSSKLFFDLFLKIFDIRNDPSLKPKVRILPHTLLIVGGEES